MPLAPRVRRNQRRPIGRMSALRRVAVGRYRRFRRKVLGSAVHTFKEKVQLLSISIPAGTTVYGTQTFKLSDLLNSGSFTSLFDMYKLTGVKCMWNGLVNTSEASVGNAIGQAGSLPMLYVAPNRDPYVPAPVSVADILNDDGCKIIRLTKPFSKYIDRPKPDLRDEANQRLPFQFNVRDQPWLTTGGNNQLIDQSTVEHYGFRYAITNNSSLQMVVQVYATYYFQMKEQD